MMTVRRKRRGKKLSGKAYRVHRTAIRRAIDSTPPPATTGTRDQTAALTVHDPYGLHALSKEVFGH